MGTGAAVGWVLVVPVKRLGVAKSRLGPPYSELRSRLALAFAQDTVAAALATPEVAGVVVVTDEPGAARRLFDIGAYVVPDAPNAGLNPALRHGAQVAVGQWPGRGTGALSADLPALRPAELERVLRRAEGHRAAFLRDGDGRGTTLTVAAPGALLEPLFGADSASRHLAAGHAEVPGDDVPSVRQDVDTAADLDSARLLGVGPATARVLAELG